MTRGELIGLITELQEHRTCELPNVEVKAARKGTPKGLHETISAFANGTGGVIILSMNEAGEPRSVADATQTLYDAIVVAVEMNMVAASC